MYASTSQNSMGGPVVCVGVEAPGPQGIVHQAHWPTDGP